jgi:hypothetical protein
MPASVMRLLLRAYIERLLPKGALEVTRLAEQSERQYLKLLSRPGRSAKAAQMATPVNRKAHTYLASWVR